MGINGLILTILMVLPGALTQNVRPSFKIEASNILCSNTERNFTSVKPSIFTIRLIPEGDQKLSYHIRLSYEYSIPTRTQHHSLLIWRTVRTIEEQLNAQKTLIDAANKIDIATGSLTPGVIYIFSIQGENESGQKSSVEKFVLDYKEGNLYRICRDQDILSENSNVSISKVATTTALDEIIPEENVEKVSQKVSSISLLGPKHIYANLPLLLKAKVNFIGNPNEYYIRWNLNNTDEKFKNILASKGNTLSVPAFMFQSGAAYLIEAELVDAATSAPVVKTNHTLKVLVHELKMLIVPVNGLVGVGRSVDIELIIVDLNVKKTIPKIQWRCLLVEKGSEAESLCDRFNDSPDLKKSIIFTKPGKYKLQAIVTNEQNLTVERVSTIDVKNEIIARTVISSLPKMPSDVSNWIRGQASVEYVVPKCTVKWSIVNEQGYAYTNITTLQSGGIGGIIVNDFESNFLKELNDFTNSTVTKHVKLHIPPANYYPDWTGLLPNAKYKLRVTTNCPQPIKNVDQEEKSKSLIESYLEVELETNSSPKTAALHVTPETGLALLTSFNFKIQAPAEDKNTPLTYAFGIYINDMNIILDKGYDLLEINTFLPYSSTTIATYYEVCDIFQACTAVNGSSLTIAGSNNLTIDFTRMQLDVIESKLDRMEYNSSLNQILMLGLSLKVVPDDSLYKEFRSNIIQMIKAETKRILKVYEDKSVYLSDIDILIYVQNVKRIIETFGIHDRDMITDLLKVLGKVSSKVESMNEARDIKKRRKRQIDVHLKEKHSSVVGTAIGLLNWIDQINDFNEIFNLSTDKLKWLCREAEQDSGTFQTIKLKGDKDFRKELFKVPARGLEGSTWIKLNQLYDFDKKYEYCIGTMYNRSFTYPIYQLNVYGRKLNGTDENFELIKPKYDTTNADLFQISVYINNTLKPETVDCEMYVNGLWNSTVCVKILDEKQVEKNKLSFNCTRNEPFQIKVNAIEPVSNSIALTDTTVVPTVAPTQSTIQTRFDTTLIPVSTSTATNISVNATTMQLEGSTDSYLATIGYSALALLGLGCGFGILSLYFYKQSKKKNNSFALDLQAIAAEARAQIPGIRYARFHDENIMRGDGIYTTSG